MSDETKHTEGPWVVAEDSGEAVVTLAAVEVRDIIIATLPRVNHANARIIAAAPDLLAALKMLAMVVGEQSAEEVDDGSIYSLAMAHAAIAKAEGRQS